MSWDVWHGDCRDILRMLPSNYFDSIAMDPPYGLGFMGAEWDKFGKGGMKPATIARQKAAEKRNEPFGRSGKAAAPSFGEKQAFKAFIREVGTECLRVLKPGAHALAFGGTRTYHWMADAWEDAGFEIRDQLMWLYGQGFPKSVNIAKAIDKAAGVQPLERRPASLGMKDNENWNELKTQLIMPPPTTPKAKQWAGWGSALKPAFEPLILARKPFKGPIYKNVLKHGTGGLNLDDCRIGENAGWSYPKGKGGSPCHGGGFKNIPCKATKGRWPANVILDEEAGRLLDEQSGISKDGVAVKRHGKGGKFFAQEKDKLSAPAPDQGFGGAGGASRFFYCPKPSRKEKDAGLTEKCKHPTVKPLALLRYLARLITPPNGLLLDPFAGSGSQGCACVLEGFRYLGIEQDAAYVEMAHSRIAYWAGESHD